jgi:hypothetical protein
MGSHWLFMIKALLLFLFNGLLCLILLCPANIAFARDEIKTSTNFSFNNLSSPFASRSGSNATNLLPPPSYSKHYIAPAPWQYWSKANEIVITSDIGTVTGTIKKSDGTVLFNFTCTQGTPYVQRFTGLPKDVLAHQLNTVLNGAGLIIEATGSISVNLRM